MNNVLDQRTLGKFPVSIGTAIALEVLFGVNDDKPHPSNVPKYYLYYQSIEFNVKTLLRNMLNSISANALQQIDIADVLNTLASEIITIRNLVTDNSEGKVSCSFYINSYKKINKLFKKANYKVPSTGKQQFLNHIETKICEQIVYSKVLQGENINLITSDYTISTHHVKSLLLTHLPVDLLLFTSSHIYLLESHTGKIKDAQQLHTKLKSANENIPFNKFTIQLYGDTGGMFLSTDSKLARQLNELSKESPIISVMSEDAFYRTVKRIGSPELSNELSSMR